MKNIFLIAVIFFTSNIFSQTNKDFEILLTWMQGSYNSEEQSRNDSDYYNISLEMKKIWTNNTDGYWLYVEQAVAKTKDQPYRQRIYHLIFEDDLIKSIIYSLPNEKKFIGGWKNTEIFNDLVPDSLQERKGCEVIIKRPDENTFIGSTVEKNCSSNLRGASYATTEVTILKNTLLSWDRGYNDKDEQVWGAVKGGYVFKKIKK
jgi:hypothetical protein